MEEGWGCEKEGEGRGKREGERVEPERTGEGVVVEGRQKESCARGEREGERGSAREREREGEGEGERG